MVNKKDTFSALSMKDRAELLNIYVKGGMVDLKEIKAHYNNLYEEKEPNKYGWGGASKEALGKAFSDASSTVGSVGNIAGNVMTMVSNGMENAEINTTEADNAIEAVKSYKLDNSSLDTLANSYNATPWAATDYDSSDFTKSGWEIAGNTFESTLSGITTGASIGGPWGAVIGGLAGLGSGLIGWGIGESKAEEAERRLEEQARKANRAIELNAVNTRDSILQKRANNTLRNIAADGGRLNKFGDGGDTKSEQENSGYATTTKQDLEDVETFNSNWYKYRDKQLADAVRSYYAPQHITRGLSFWQNSFPEFVNDTKLAGGARNYINERLEALKEFTIEEAVKDNQAKQVLIDDYYSYFPNERTENEVEIGPPRIPDNQSLIRLHNLIYKGGYSKPAHLITYSNGHENTSTKIHERAHASIYQDVMGYHSVLKPIRNVVLKQGVNAHKYYDKLTEVYSRLMQLRFENNIDPTHTYTLEEVEAMRNDPNFKDFHIFDRYTDDSILMLLNEVAHNNTDSNRLDYVNPDNIAAYGGRILDGTEEEQTTTGLPVGAGLATYNHPKYNHAEEAEMYSYLRSRDVPHVQASAIMGNIAVESMLNPEITQIGGGGGYGLIQATDRSRKNAFINYDGQPYEFGSNISPETQRQLDYIIDKGLNTQTRGEWRGNHNIGKASVARRKFLEATDVNKASKIFTENYLRPGKPHTKRRKSMSNYFYDNYGITERALKEFENSFLFQNN